MKIVRARPPLWEEIHAAFPMASKPGVIFTWGDTIYNPSGVVITPELKAHEGVHFSRQTNHPPAIEAWWRRYIADPEFRFAEELPAHRAEYQAFRNRVRCYPSRAAFANALAQRLASPLYGSLATPAKARSLILN